MSWEVKQSIDFYLDEFKPPRLPDDLKFILVGVGLHAVFAVVLIGGLLINGYVQSAYFQRMSMKQSDVERQVSNIENERPSLQLDPALVAERDSAGNSLESSRRILQYLTQQDIGESHSFSGLVTDLSEQRVSGVWLSGFRFSGEGHHVRLTGHAFDPVKVSAYAGSLLDKPSYQGRSFRFIQVGQEDEKSYLSFVLDTRNKGDESGATEQTVLTSRAIMRQL